MNEMFRQGDVLLRKIDSIPKGAKVKERGAVVLAYGETSGHKHVIQQATMLIMKSPVMEETYLQVEKPTQLVHEEHGTIEVPAGNYLVVRQREYSPEAPRTISD